MTKRARRWRRARVLALQRDESFPRVDTDREPCAIHLAETVGSEPAEAFRLMV